MVGIHPAYNILTFFFFFWTRLQLLVSVRRMVLNLPLTISATPSATRNRQTNLSLPTSRSWKLLSTRPSNGSMPLKKDRKKSMKRNKRSSKGLPSMLCLLHLVPIFTYLPFFSSPIMQNSMVAHLVAHLVASPAVHLWSNNLPLGRHLTFPCLYDDDFLITNFLLLTFPLYICPQKSMLAILTRTCLWVNTFQISLPSHSMFPASMLKLSTIKLPRQSWIRFSRSGNRTNGLAPKIAKNWLTLSLSNYLPINSLHLSAGSRPKIFYLLPSTLNVSLR